MSWNARILVMVSMLVVTGAAGCGRDWDQVEVTAAYGECLGYCRTAVGLDTAASGTIEHTAWRNDLTPVTRTISHPDRAALLDVAVDRARSIPWRDQYGCPDCGDQGAYTVVLTGGGTTRTTLLDPREHPAHFDPLIAFFRQIWQENPPPPLAE